VFQGVRGMGLMLGLECAVPNTEVQAACVAEGLLTVAAGQNVLRLVPPLIVTEADIGEALQRLQRAALRCMPHDSLIAAK
jgi:acetylornithine/N-succinyldiaminopimelate aminotransferase